MINFKSKTNEELKKEFINHDTAFLNSVLSYGIYTARKWTLDWQDEPVGSDDQSLMLQTLIKSQIENPDDITLRKAYELYLTDFNRKTFTAVNLDMPAFADYHSEKYGYDTRFKTRTGYYETLDNLGSAGIFTSIRNDGKKILHLTFRGTDTNARPFKDFVTGAYLDMSAYYDAFKPLEKAVLNYAKNPDNNIAEIQVSGHSLGGACVQEFFKSKDVNDSKMECKGYTYGAPGSVKRFWYIMLPALYHTVKHRKFLQLGKSVMDFAITDNHKPDPRVTQYKHDGDLIPKSGSLGYKSNGKKILLWDRAGNDYQNEFLLGNNKSSEDLKNLQAKKDSNFFAKVLFATHFFVIKNPPQVLKKAFSFQYHDMLRYIINLHHHMNNQMKKYPQANLTTVTPVANQFNDYQKRFEKIITNRYDLRDEEVNEKLDTKLQQINQAVPNAQKVMNTIRKVRLLSEVSEDLGGQAINIEYVKKQPV
jgi:hypothetical protein